MARPSRAARKRHASGAARSLCSKSVNLYCFGAKCIARARGAQRAVDTCGFFAPGRPRRNAKPVKRALRLRSDADRDKGARAGPERRPSGASEALERRTRWRAESARIASAPLSIGDSTWRAATHGVPVAHGVAAPHGMTATPEAAAAHGGGASARWPQPAGVGGAEKRRRRPPRARVGRGNFGLKSFCCGTLCPRQPSDCGVPRSWAPLGHHPTPAGPGVRSAEALGPGVAPGALKPSGHAIHKQHVLAAATPRAHIANHFDA